MGGRRPTGCSMGCRPIGATSASTGVVRIAYAPGVGVPGIPTALFQPQLDHGGSTTERARPCRFPALACAEALQVHDSGAPVRARTSASVTPGAISTRTSPSSVTSMTARSVMIRSTQRLAGQRQRALRDDLRRAVPGDVLHHHDHLAAPWTRSIAPPMPLTILPGTIQLARSPSRGDLHRAEHGDVDVAAADHREDCRRSRRSGARAGP